MAPAIADSGEAGEKGTMSPPNRQCLLDPSSASARSELRLSTLALTWTRASHLQCLSPRHPSSPDSASWVDMTKHHVLRIEVLNLILLLPTPTPPQSRSRTSLSPLPGNTGLNQKAANLMQSPKQGMGVGMVSQGRDSFVPSSFLLALGLYGTQKVL